MCNNKYQIIMAEELELPKISTETREKIRAMGFVNHLYDSTNLPSAYIPRGCGFNALTYAVMGFSLVGAVFAKRLSFEPTTFIFTFLAAPTMAFIQKKEADTLFFSQFSKQNPATILARYPLLNQSYKQVSQEVDTEISSAKERIRLLEEHSRRSSN